MIRVQATIIVHALSPHLARNTNAAVIARYLQVVTPADPLHPTEHARDMTHVTTLSPLERA
ncbi:hypothetical protein [Nonomuraea sp. NPDC003754]